MTIRLETLIPLPLLEQKRKESDIWERYSLVFSPGLSYIVEAPSGKGKTSLLSIIYGLRRDYRGKVSLDGEDIAGFSGKQWSVIRKRQLAFIFQGLELFDELTAMENIQLKNAMTGYKTLSEVEEMAGLLDMDAFLQQKTGILSFGQQQRVAIIRALCQPFDFLLADECFSHMDRKNSLKAFELVRKECEQRDAGLILTSLDNMEEVGFDRRFSL
jgi:putative ABC transport system ATP-binding protein